MSDLEEDYALGLDLGTTFSCIGVYRKGGVEIIPNRNGERTTPSVVTILDDSTIVKGEDTLDYLVKEYDSSIYAIKRFIGREYNDSSVKNEIEKENFPFKIIGEGENKKIPKVSVKKNNKIMEFSLEEISSFIIRKMVDNAEAFLDKNVKKLVITVPANFNDAQRNCTKQAAKLAGVEVLRIINEPTAAALAYGLGENNDQDDKNILVFDLGGGTFDVTILRINRSEETNFEILSTNGDKFLGGEDFDNKLVEYVLDDFCGKNNESKEKIKQDKKIIRKLKIHCEIIKKTLSSNYQTNLCINNFYNGQVIMKIIKKSDFESITSDLIERLREPIEKALIDAKLNKNEINEIVMVGGSSRIPKVKKFLEEIFIGVKINDSINPDETVAYGATLMAAKILIKKDKNLKGFNLMDITPLSLGIEVLNNNPDPEIRKEGNLMSVIIKRSQKIPFTNIETYETVEDNQTCVNAIIYEGEKKYTKYNHILGNLILNNLPKKKKGEVKIDVKFFIDVNGILTVTATEQSTGNSVETQIKNDSVNLTDEDIEKLKEKNKKYLEKTKIKKALDFSNIKETLKEFQDAYNETEEEEDKYSILMNYNNTLEEFVDSFDINNFDNETVVEKYYIYVSQLINSYINTLKLKNYCKGEEQTQIKEKIKKYIEIFSKTSLGYLNTIIENELKILNEDEELKKIFFEIIMFLVERINELGKECLEKRAKFCKYNSLIYFEKSENIFSKYIGKPGNLSICDQKLVDKAKEITKSNKVYINEINSGAILLFDESLKSGKLISSNYTGLTKGLYGLKFDKDEDAEKYQIILNNYEAIFSEFMQGKKSIPSEQKKKAAICIANIIKINFNFLGNSQYQRYIELGEKCKLFADDENAGIDKNEDWYQELMNMINEIKDLNKLIQEVEKMKKEIKAKYRKKFDEIDSKFAKKKNEQEFIDYILELRPYDGYEKDKSKNVLEDKKKEGHENMVKYLINKYNPSSYSCDDDDEQSKLDYCIVDHIHSYLKIIFTNIQ